MMYLKAGARDGERALFTLYGADGTPYVVVDAIRTAAEIVAKLGLSLVAVH